MTSSRESTGNSDAPTIRKASGRCTSAWSTFAYSILLACLLPTSLQAATYYWQRDTGTSVAGFTTNTPACGDRPQDVYLFTLMTSGGFNCTDIRHEGTVGVPQNLWLMIKDTSYAVATDVTGIDFALNFEDDSSGGVTARYELGYAQGGVFTSFGFADEGPHENQSTYVTDLSSISGTAPAGSNLALRIIDVAPSGGDMRMWMGSDFGSGILNVTETVAAPSVCPSGGTVSTTVDSVTGDSLRACIIWANGNAGTDTLTVPAGTYTLTIAGIGEEASATGDLDITDDIIINGNAAAATIIDANGIDRVFDILGADMTASNLTIRDGNAGVGTEDGGGVAIDATGSLNLFTSTVTGNSGDDGGGIFNNGGTVTLENVTVSGNTTTDTGAGVHCQQNGPCTLTNVTVTGNDAASTGDGVMSEDGSDVTFLNTIVANNVGVDCVGPAIDFVSNGYNISSDATCDFTNTGDQENTDPLLGPLQNNGGPTDTHDLLVGSPAIEAGTNTGCPATDQRGTARPDGTTCDIGAVEGTAPALPVCPGAVVTDTGDAVTGGSLRACIIWANGNPGADAIAFNIPGAGPHTIVPASALPTITDPVTIDGSTEPDFAGTPVVEIDGSSAGVGARGLQLLGGSNGSTIRGLVINNFDNRGIHVASASNTIAGNWIGLDIDGVTAAGNNTQGLFLTGAGDNNTIGGTVAADRNVISANTQGIHVRGDNNVIIGNYVGTNSAGAVAGVGNTSQGIRLNTNANNNMIGGTAAADANIIAGNSNDGIDHRSTGTANSFLRNSIHSNSLRGIDLANDGVATNGADGVTANDAGDPDLGANNLLNFPVITSASETAGTLNVNFDLDVPAGNYRIEFFTNPSGADPSGNGEGEVYQSTVTIAHGGTGVESFSHSFAGSDGDILTVTATEEFGGPPFGATSEFSAAFTAASGADMALTKTDSADPVPLSSPFTYTLTATNNGPDTANNVTIVDTLPADVSFESATPSQGSCLHTGEPTGGTVTCTLGTILNAANATVDINVTAPITAGGINNSATVSADEADPVAGNNTANEPTTIVDPQANLRVTQVDSLDPNGVNLPHTYTVTVTNQGPSDGTGVTLVDTLDAAVVYVSATPSQGACLEAAGVVTCTLGALANGTSATVDIVVTLPGTPQTVTNTAVVSGTEPDLDLGDNTSLEDTTVTNPPPTDLELLKSDSPDPVVEGNPLTYTLTVTNTGPGPATNVLVVDTLPAGVTFISATPSTGTCNPPSPTVDCDLGTLSNGSVETIDIVVTAPIGAGVITNNAVVSTTRVDPNPANDSASEDTTVTVPGGADVALSKSDSPDPVNVTQTFSYTLTVDNLGPDEATDVVLVDTLPATVAYQSSVPSQGSCVHSGEPLGGTVTCTLGTIANATNATANIFVTAPISTGSITNNASVSTTAVDGNPANDTASEDTTVQNNNINQLCYLVADAGGGGGGNDLLTRIDTADFDPLTNETNIGIGTGTFNIEAIAWNGATSTLYAANAGQLGTLNTTTGVFTALPSSFGTGTGALGAITFNDVDGLAYDATTGILFGVEVQGGTDVLIQINMATGAHVPDAFGAGIDYVPIPPVLGNSITDDIAVDPITGVMYAAVNAGGSTDRLININKVTGATSDIALITVPDIEGLGTDVSGQLWGTSGTQGILYELSKTTGIGSNPRTIDNGFDYEAVDCDQLSPGVIADLAVTKGVDNPTPNEGATITYTINVTNNGPAGATVIQIADPLPVGVTYISDTPTQGSYDGFTGNWFVGNLASLATATLTIQASVDAGTAGSTITNTASVTFLSQSDPVAGNDSDSVDIDPVPSNPIVNSTRDVADAAPGNGVCDTGALNTQGATECTLRAAIEEANALAGADNIDFNIPTTELGYSAAPLSYTIQLGSGLPFLTEQVFINGATQPDFPGTPIVVIDGTSVAAGVHGLQLDPGSDSSTIRGFVINNFDARGIHVVSSSNTIAGNWFGLDVDGVTAAANSRHNISISAGADNNTIGGIVANDRNVISASGEAGMIIQGDNNDIIGNYIGTDSSGAVAGLGNAFTGIRIESTANNNTIGGTNSVDANTITDNGFDGIRHMGSGVANSFLGNSIHSNSLRGIDLGGDNVTANDAGDPDPGPNNLLNYPEPLLATVSGANVTVDYGLDVPAGDYRMEFFTNPSGGDPSGNGEGEVFTSTVNINHPGGGSQNFSHAFPGAAGDIISVTTTLCTDGTCNAFVGTSEFSQFVTAAVPGVIKRAFWPDGTPIPTASLIPSGVEFKYMLYINNSGGAVSDVSVRDVLDPAFLYQTPTIQVDNSVVECALAVCTPAEEQTIFTAVNGATVLTDALGDDVVSYSAPNLDAGDGNVGNLQLNVNADAVWALLFSVKMP